MDPPLRLADVRSMGVVALLETATWSPILPAAEPSHEEGAMVPIVILRRVVLHAPAARTQKPEGGVSRHEHRGPPLRVLLQENRTRANGKQREGEGWQ